MLENPPEITDKTIQKIINGQLSIKLGQFTEEELRAVLKKKKTSWKAVCFDEIAPEV